MSKNAVMPLSDYVAACDKVREKTGTTDLIKSGELPDKVGEVYERGRDAEWNEFWDNFQQNGTRKNYQRAFFSKGWNDNNFNPKYDIVIDDTWDSGSQMFMYSEITDLKGILDRNGVILDFSKAKQMQNAFQESKITNMPDIDVGNVTEKLMLTFYMLPATSLIIKNIRENCEFDRAFDNMYNLTNLSLTGVIGQNGLNFRWSTNLTKDSLMNIINCLMAYTVADELVLPNTSGSVVLSNAKLIEGKNYLMEFRSYEFNGASSPLYVGSQNMTASKVNIGGVGERVGVWRECDFWADPDIYWYRVYIYQDGDDIKELRYRINKQTGEVIPHALAGDILSLAVDQNATHSVTLGEANLNKLTDDEKAIATQKGWVLN